MIEEKYKIELPGDENLEMMPIPGGTFLMGSPPDEPDRGKDEGPQHQVTVPEFWMGKFPVTQAQWRAVAALPKVERDLSPDPSYFKGDNRPVEQVTWFDAVEFCARLSAYTNRACRLPTEPEWEYACRAGTETPFHYGETLTTDLANYCGTGSYGRGPKGEYREETTDVGSFQHNALGLFDMHGNVFEWCEDRYHYNYEGAPSGCRVSRGGSWCSYPWDCRSASRNSSLPDSRDSDVGFRVVCALH